MLIFSPDCFKVTLRLHNDTAANTTVGVFMCRRGGVNLEMGDCGTALVLEGDLAARFFSFPLLNLLYKDYFVIVLAARTSCTTLYDALW